MVNGVGGGGSAARDAVLAAIAKHQAQAQSVQGRAQGLESLAAGEQAQSASGSTFAAELKEGLTSLQKEMSATEALPERMMRGEINDLHEVAVELKKSDLSFRFALQVRNKLIDAYREVMRMNV